MESLAERLKSRRTQRGLSQKEFSSRLGISQSQYNRYENGADPSTELLAKMAVELQCTSDYLLSLVDKPSEHLEEEGLPPDQQKLLELYRNNRIPREIRRLLGDPSFLIEGNNDHPAIPSGDQSEAASDEIAS